MKMENFDNDLIENYLDGTMSEKEICAFNERLLKNKEFAELFTNRQRLQSAYIKALENSELKRHIKTLIDHEKHKYSIRMYIWLAAATVFIFAGVGGLLLYQTEDSIKINKFAKHENMSDEDKLVEPSKNRIKEYGSTHTLQFQNAKIAKDGMVLSQRDTILFTRENTDVEEILYLSDSTHTIVKQITLIEGTSVFKLLPHSLKSGTYYWCFSHEDITRFFLIE